MKLLPFLIVAFGVVFSSAALAQTDSLSKKFEFSEITIQFGNLNTSQVRLSAHTAKQLAPQSSFLNSTFTGYQQNEFYSNYGPSFSFGGHMGFKLPKKSNHSLRPTLRMGLLYNKSDILWNNFAKLNAVTVDSLTNGSGVVTKYIQNVNEETIEARYTNDQLWLDANLTYAINSNGYFSMFMGAGLGAGLMFNAQTTVSYRNTTFTRETSSNRSSGTNYNYDFVAFEEETFKNQAGFTAMAYFPLGFDFRLGKKDEAWRLAHVFFELRPGVMLQTIPEVNLNLLRTTLVTQFGFRFDLR